MIYSENKKQLICKRKKNISSVKFGNNCEDSQNNSLYIFIVLYHVNIIGKSYFFLSYSQQFQIFLKFYSTIVKYVFKPEYFLSRLVIGLSSIVIWKQIASFSVIPI